MPLLQLFSDNLLPVLLVAAAGYLVAASTKVDPRALSGIGFNLLAPCLVFQVIVDSRVPFTALLRIMGFTACVLLGLGACAWLVARAARWPRPLSSAVVLCVMLPNAANYGMSANLLAFGQDALTHASLFFLTSSILTYTVGVLVASLGRTSVRAALAGLAKVPTVWAVPLAFVLVKLGWTLPGPLASAVSLTAQACVPVFLLILGMQLRGATLRARPAPLLWATGLRLAGGAAAGLLLAPLFGLEGAARQASVFQSAMPAAVINTILATEYDVEPGFVTSVVFLTTLASPLTLTPLMALLARG